MNFMVILNQMENLQLYNISSHTNINQNRIKINLLERIFLNSRNFFMSERWSFFSEMFVEELLSE